VWDAAPCEGSPYYALRNATVATDDGAAGDGDTESGGGDDTSNASSGLGAYTLTLSEPERYTGLRGGGGWSKGERVGTGVGVIHQTRGVVAGLVLLATVAAAVAVQVSRAARGEEEQEEEAPLNGGGHADLESAMLAKHGGHEAAAAYGATGATGAASQQPASDSEEAK
jgi:hypothetical protein